MPESSVDRLTDLVQGLICVAIMTLVAIGTLCLFVIVASCLFIAEIVARFRHWLQRQRCC